MAETLPVVNGSSGTWGSVLNTAIGNIDTRVAAATATNGTQDTNITSVTGRVGALETGTAGAINVSTLTTKGDLLVATGSGAVSRLGVGAAGQFLAPTPAAGGGLAWALNPGQLVFSARATTAQSLPDLTSVFIIFQTEDYDRLNVFTPGAASSTYTPGVAGWYEVTGNVYFGNAQAGYRGLYWNVDGADVNAGGATAAYTPATGANVNARTMPLLLTATSVISLRAYHNAGATISTNVATAQQSSIAVKWLGP
jgi:hypothetical protein